MLLVGHFEKNTQNLLGRLGWLTKKPSVKESEQAWFSMGLTGATGKDPTAFSMQLASEFRSLDYFPSQN